MLANGDYVWAMDEWHVPIYYFPRDCPRACFWPGIQTTPEDRERWFGGIEAKMVIAVEPVGDLLAALTDANVELRITPSLTDLWSRVITSTLEFSGTRLRNAQGRPINA